MGERRKIDDRKGSMRELQREARAEFERAQQSDTGGQEHASRADREGIPPGRRPIEAATRDARRATAAQSDAERLRRPRGDAVTGGGGNVTRGPRPAGAAEPGEE
jgi:hypothetical protein